MSGAGFILAINLAMAGFLAASFLAIAVYDTSRVSARWLAAAYALGMVNFGMEFAIPWLAHPGLAVVLSFGSILGAMALFNVGLASRYHILPPAALMTGLFAVSLVTVWLIQDLPRHAPTRMFAYQAPYFLMQAIGAAIVLAARPRRALDHALVALLVLSALQFLSKPLLALAFGGWGENPQAYLDSTYALISQSMGTVFAIALALMMFIVLMRDVLDDVTEKSETDTLSGLLNRRGFEARAEQALRAARRQKMPLSLVIADLDHFKSINDTHGHAAGDRVIAAFSGFLRATGQSPYATGRIGGEEFAIVLPGANLAAARLFAEGARNAFPALAIDGLPGMRCTASYGVAELMAGEGLADLMRRADAALYEAKNAGRDCVRVSRPEIVPRQLAS
ncbi:MAG: GGDEF domain-containing protein [Rhizobiaceae bacterium]|nr:GGDEF domain-containing protein [Rhizobiaceae bacterium]